MKQYRQIQFDNNSPKAEAIRRGLVRRIVGQEDAVKTLVELMEKFESNLYDDNRPVGSVLFLGPTGSGKTRIVEALSETMYDEENHFIRVDCAEYQHSHEIAKLVGSPPGYLGHRETPAILNQESVNKLKTQAYPLTIVLFDEIEKASDALWHLLLAVLDKGRISLGDGSVTNLSKTLIIMTSNVGSVDMNSAMFGGLGFSYNTDSVDDKEIEKIGVDAARKKFTPEFLNRLDKIQAFHALTEKQIACIADIELDRLQNIICRKVNPVVMLQVSPAAKRQLTKDGYDPKQNGRHIRRAIEREIGLPVSRIVSQKLVIPGQNLIVDYVEGQFTFGVVDKSFAKGTV